MVGGGCRLVGRGVSVSRSHMSFYIRTGEGDWTTRVVLLTESLILAGCQHSSFCIDTSSDVGLYMLSFTVIFATDTGGSKTPPPWPGGS